MLISDLTFFISHVLSPSQHCDWVFPLLMEIQQRLPDVLWFLPESLGRLHLSKPTVRSWWSQRAVMAVCHFYSWQRQWFDTLWVTLIRSWLHSFLSFYFWFCWHCQKITFKVFLRSFLCNKGFLWNLIDMLLEWFASLTASATNPA